MNLNAIAAPLTRAVTPSVVGTLLLSTGYTTSAADGTQTPTYDERTLTRIDVQSLTGGDLRRLDGLGIQGVNSCAYLAGNIEGINRSRGKGGDLVVIPTGPSAGTYLVQVVLETWPDWCKVALTQQVATP